MKIKAVSIDPMNPALVLGLSLVTVGLFLPFWIYLKNREFETLCEEEAPHSARGIILLFVLPLLWLFISQIMPKSIAIVGFAIILVLVLKYLFDFCEFYSQLTKTHFFIYFTLFTTGVLGLYLTLFNTAFIVISLAFFLAVPLMQQELNMLYKTLTLKREKKNFYNSYH
ncbi:MAG: hypothetical protein VXZ40_03395 [Nanoarchaeota archaeon]|nr:hypothetical protein [Nanoarchaeota archaeon]